MVECSVEAKAIFNDFNNSIYNLAKLYFPNDIVVLYT
jgi:hypothetical protein